ncbi:hypothetical protein [uncultured Erythrobacter sp.]|uniref:hypothetical protein n=1 Tax=uncultured Erythrobacter sp. TaxID=263913 RepID=UPI0026060D38|nr:hypothetical protein [uncultured Erythrobacter sp.]
MTKTKILTLPFLFLLPSCALFDDTDPRELAEPLEQCLARFGDLKAELADDASNVQATPILTFDITKLSLGEIQELVKPGSDDTAGQRLMQQTNETGTAVQLFKTEPVDENGSFFLGRDPALYRVRTDPVWPRDAVEAACEMQKAGMRLIDINVAHNITIEPAPETDDTGTLDETQN